MDPFGLEQFASHSANLDSRASMSITVPMRTESNTPIGSIRRIRVIRAQRVGAQFGAAMPNQEHPADDEVVSPGSSVERTSKGTAAS